MNNGRRFEAFMIAGSLSWSYMIITEGLTNKRLQSNLYGSRQIEPVGLLDHRETVEQRFSLPRMTI
jgi:hypothetical protein